MFRRRACAVVAGIMLLVSVSAHAGTRGGDVLWQDEFGVVEFSASAGRVAAIGTIPNRRGGRIPIVRVYDDEGRVLWQDAIAAQSVVLDGNRVVVAGEGVVQAFDARRGRLKWEDTPPFVVAQLYRDGDTTLATAVNPEGTAIRIRMYDTRHGEVLVHDRTLPLAGVTTFSGGNLYAATSVARTDPTGVMTFPCQLSAYSIATGQRLWVTTQPVLSPNTRSCFPLALTADRKHAILAGIGGFGDEFMAQGYDAKTGAFLWQHLPQIGTAAVNAAVAVDAVRRLAFVAGWTRSLAPGAFASDQDFVIHALDTDTGALRWDGRTRAPDCPAPSTGSCLAHARLVVVDSGTVYGAGFRGENGVSIPGTGFLRAYEARTGRLRWQDEDVDVEAMDASRGVVVVLTPGAGEEDAILRAYDGR